MQYAEYIKVIKLTTGIDVDVSDLEKAKKENTPYTIDELIADPFKEDHTWLIYDRPALIESFVDRTLDCQGRYVTVFLDEILDYIEDVKNYPDDYGLTKEDIKDAKDWLLENRFGSMTLDW